MTNLSHSEVVDKIWSNICSDLDGHKQTTLQAPELVIAEEPTEGPVVSNSILSQFSITGESANMAQHLQDEMLVLSVLAIRGQWTVIYSAPNTGKTLLTLHLLTERLGKNPELASRVYYINADDNQKGSIEKTRIAEEFGFNMLVPGHKGFNTHHLPTQLEQICQANEAADTIIIVDTLKKSVDLMKKSQLRDFGNVVRKFVSQGGTFIGLAHTNKKNDQHGRPVPEGTADIINDADCIFIADEMVRDADSKTVRLTNTKNRGGSFEPLYFRYAIEQQISYEELMATVEQIEASEVEAFRTLHEKCPDEDVIENIKLAIHHGITSKMAIRDVVACAAKVSRRTTLGVLEAYTGETDGKHWNYRMRGHGKREYYLLEPSVSVNEQHPTKN